MNGQVTLYLPRLAKIRSKYLIFEVLSYAGHRTASLTQFLYRLSHSFAQVLIANYKIYLRILKLEPEIDIRPSYLISCDVAQCYEIVSSLKGSGVELIIPLNVVFRLDIIRLTIDLIEYEGKY